MRSTGLTEDKLEDELFSFLLSVKKNDRQYHHVLSSMCTLPHPVAVRAMNLFIESNPGDPGLFEETASLEALLVKRLGSLMHLSEECGYATSGGSGWHAGKQKCSPQTSLYRSRPTFHLRRPVKSFLLRCRPSHRITGTGLMQMSTPSSASVSLTCTVKSLTAFSLIRVVLS